MKENRVVPDIWMETGQLHTIKNLVIRDGCGAFLLRDAVRMDDQICALSLENSMRAEIGLITRRGKVIYNDARTLISLSSRS